MELRKDVDVGAHENTDGANGKPKEVSGFFIACHQ
jgi:hypothetical protein